MGDVIDRYSEDCELNCSWLDFQKLAAFVTVLLLHTFIAPAYHLSGHAVAASLPASEFVVPGGPVILLQDGQRIDGHIVRLDQTNVIVRLADGAEQTLPRATIDTVRFATVTGMEVAGALIGWKPGVYELTTDEAVITVYSAAPPRPAQDDGAEEIVNVAEVGTAETEAANVEAAEVEQDEILGGASLPAGTSNGEEPDTAPVNGLAASDDDVDMTAQGGPPAGLETQVAAVATSPDLEIIVSTGSGRENGSAVAFDFELSRPSDKSVVLIYATIDGTAISGEDYEAARGVLVIKAGETSARIEAPVIDDDLIEDMEQLQLFLTVDPNVAVVKTRQIVATIEDDDQG